MHLKEALVISSLVTSMRRVTDYGYICRVSLNYRAYLRRRDRHGSAADYRRASFAGVLAGTFGTKSCGVVWVLTSSS